jgi:hypothetical protein
MRELLRPRMKGLRICLPRSGVSWQFGLRAPFLIVSTVVCVRGSPVAASGSLHPSTMKKIGNIDERYQSYNVEMAEVTGGSFWKPYARAGPSPSPAAAAGSDSKVSVPGGMDPKLYSYTKSIVSSIAAIEFMNEPTMAKIGGAPSDYTGAHYGLMSKSSTLF